MVLFIFASRLAVYAARKPAKPCTRDVLGVAMAKLVIFFYCEFLLVLAYILEETSHGTSPRCP